MAIISINEAPGALREVVACYYQENAPLSPQLLCVQYIGGPMEATSAFLETDGMCTVFTHAKVEETQYAITAHTMHVDCIITFMHTSPTLKALYAPKLM